MTDGPPSGPKPDPGRPVVAGVGRAALVIGGLTVLARVLGFARTLVFAGTVKTSCLSAAYVTANQVPNVVYDIVLGGALTAIVVPVLAGPAEESAASDEARSEVGAISSALLTWTVAILVPVSLALAFAAGPAISVLMPTNPGSGCVRATLVPVAAQMLAVFAPQILLYGLAVVLYGILQAHRKFTAPALAPVLSSLVVIAAYGLFVPLGSKHTAHVAGLSLAAELTLSLGTTLGVAALMLIALRPVWRLGIKVRPALNFPPEIARRARNLAGVGIAALVAQDASVLVVTRLANARGASHGSAVTVYSYGWQAFVSVYAVLAVPIAEGGRVRRGLLFGHPGDRARVVAGGCAAGRRRRAGGSRLSRLESSGDQPVRADAGRVRAGTGRLRLDRVPFPGVARRRPQPGRGHLDGDGLGGGDRGRRGGGSARGGQVGGAGPRRCQHGRHDRLRCGAAGRGGEDQGSSGAAGQLAGARRGPGRRADGSGRGPRIDRRPAGLRASAQRVPGSGGRGVCARGLLRGGRAARRR